MQYGWGREQIVVIDDDLGCSGASVEDRAEAFRRARVKPRPKLSRRPRSVRVWQGTCFRRSATVELPTLVALIVAGMKSVVGAGANGRPRYRRKECRKTFGPLMGTPLVGLHYRDRWMDQAHALEQVAKLF